MSVSSERQYHEATDFTRFSFGGGGMFRSRRPEQFKGYRGVERTRLPEAGGLPDASYAGVLGADPVRGLKFDLTGLARLLDLSHAVTAVAPAGGGGRFYLRSVPSAGALYPCELYIAASGVQGLRDGVYHHQILNRDLALLRPGNFTPFCSRACGIEGAPPGLVFIIGGLFQRCAWKYGDRAFRYCCLDAGHLAEAIVLAARALGFEASVHAGIDADAVNELVRADGEGEAALLAVAVHSASGKEIEAPLEPMEPLPGEGMAEIALNSVITAAYRASLNMKVKAAARIESGDLGLRPFEARGLPAVSAETNPFDRTVYGRRSGRRYSETLNESLAGSMLAMLRGAPDKAFRLGLISGGAGVLADGFHLLDLENGTISLVREGDPRSDFAEACLRQDFIARGPLIFVMLTDLAALEARFGRGGYRLSLIEAGRAGHRVYLAATALGLSACGVGAFLDHDVRDLLGLADASRMLYLAVAG